MALSYGRAWRLAAQNGGCRPGQSASSSPRSVQHLVGEYIRGCPTKFSVPSTSLENQSSKSANRVMRGHVPTTGLRVGRGSRALPLADARLDGGERRPRLGVREVRAGRAPGVVPADRGRAAMLACSYAAMISPIYKLERGGASCECGPRSARFPPHFDPGSSEHLSVRARLGRLSGLGVSHSRSVLCGAFVWVRGALKRPNTAVSGSGSTAGSRTAAWR